jgi:hypothetical protein
MISTVAIALFLLGWVLPEQVRYVAHPLGSGVSRLDLPAESTAFLARTRPSGKLLNAYPFGGYLIDKLPEMPVAIDGRELPFLAFSKEQREAIASGHFDAFLSKHQIDVVLEDLSVHARDHGSIASLEILYPRSDWAQVFFDNASIVYLRRTPANDAIIQTYEYKSLRRTAAPGWGATTRGLSDAVRTGQYRDLDYCLREVPDSVFCRVGKAAFLVLFGQRDEAKSLLEEARQIDPGNLEVLVALLNLANARGDKSASDALIETLNHVGHALPR